MSQEGNQKGILTVSSDKNENTAYQHLWDATKAVLRDKFIETIRTLKKKISLIPQGLVEQQAKPNVSIMKKIIRITAKNRGFKNTEKCQ